MIFYKPEEYLHKIRPIYALVKKRVSAELPEAQVEHIGSSAITGAISKGDLDILVRVSAANFEFALNRIQKMGFVEKAGTLRTDSLCMLITEDYDLDVAIQLIVSGSEFEEFALFRDRMNLRPVLVEKYNQLKLACAGMSEVEYRKIKSEFIANVLAEL